MKTCENLGTSMSRNENHENILNKTNKIMTFN